VSVHLRIVAVTATVVLFVIVFDLVRRRHLLERYALLWLGCAAALVVLASWSGLLTRIAHAVGIHYPPSALFLVAFVFVIVLLLNFSLAVSRLTDQSKVLAQRVAMLEQRQEEREAGAQEQGETAPETERERGGAVDGARLEPSQSPVTWAPSSCASPPPAPSTTASRR
jgi:hypothetical protein